MSYSKIKMCMCVEYLVANLILLCSLKTYLSFLELGNNFVGQHELCFFSGGHLSTHCFDNLDTCPFFQYSFLSFFFSFFTFA
jgi:hypothetical protein